MSVVGVFVSSSLEGTVVGWRIHCRLGKKGVVVVVGRGGRMEERAREGRARTLERKKNSVTTIHFVGVWTRWYV